MAVPVTDGGLLSCSFGTTPGTLVVEGDRTGGKRPPVLADTDLPRSFGGICSAAGNPSVYAAMLIHQTPQGTPAGAVRLYGAGTRPLPICCIPAVIDAWTRGGAALKAGEQLDTSCIRRCLWGGVISIRSPQGSG